MFIFGAFYYLSMYKQNNKKISLKKGYIFGIYCTCERLWWFCRTEWFLLQHFGWVGSKFGLFFQMCVFFFNLNRKKIIAYENICNWYNRIYCMKQSPVIIEIKSRYLNSLWQEHSKADPALGYLYTYTYSAISKFHKGTEGQSNEVMLHICKYNLQLLWA